MADYILRGTKKLLLYARSLAVFNQSVDLDRIASAINVPLLNFTGDGKDDASFVSRVYSEAEAQSLASILGVSVANVTTNGGQEIVG